MGLTARKSLPQVDRPKLRSECEPGGWNEIRPCPYAMCKWNLAVDLRVRADGVASIAHVQPGFDGWGEFDPSIPTCALDVAAAGGETRRQVARSFVWTEQAIWYTEKEALQSCPPEVRAYITSRDRANL